MPVYSMTGFGHAAIHHENTQIEVDIRSVNSRFLDLSFKLPDELKTSETAARESVGQRFSRGKIEVRAFVHRHAAASGLPNLDSLQQVQLFAAQVATLVPGARTLSVHELMGWSERMASQAASSPGNASAEVETAFTQALDQAASALLAARAREGEKLAQVLQERIDGLTTLAANAGPLIPVAVAAQRAKFLERFASIWAEASATNTGTELPSQVHDRALTEAVAFAIRIDVAEELARLNVHLAEATRLLKKGGDIGKRLEFLIQELHRECNTLGSKSTSVELTQISMDMKVLVEQMREQVQNLA